MSTEKINIALIGEPEAVRIATGLIGNFAPQQPNSDPSFVIQDFLFEGVVVNVKTSRIEIAEKTEKFGERFDAVIYAVLRSGEPPQPSPPVTPPPENESFKDKCLRGIDECFAQKVTEETCFKVTSLKEDPYYQWAEKINCEGDRFQIYNIYHTASKNSSLEKHDNNKEIKSILTTAIRVKRVLKPITWLKYLEEELIVPDHLSGKWSKTELDELTQKLNNLKEILMQEGESEKNITVV